MCIYVQAYASIHRDQETLSPLGAVVTGEWEPPGLAARNRTPVLWKDNKWYQQVSCFATPTNSQLTAILQLIIIIIDVLVFAAVLCSIFGNETGSIKQNKPTWNLLGKGTKGCVVVNQWGADMEAERKPWGGIAYKGKVSDSKVEGESRLSTIVIRQQYPFSVLLFPLLLKKIFEL